MQFNLAYSVLLIRDQWINVFTIAQRITDDVPNDKSSINDKK